LSIGASVRLFLHASLRIFRVDDEERLRGVDAQQFARGKLMIEPIDAAVLQVSKRS